MLRQNRYPWAGEIMHDPAYYRDQAKRARRLARVPIDRETQEALERLEQDYSDVAEEIRHPELF